MARPTITNNAPDGSALLLGVDSCGAIQITTGASATIDFTITFAGLYESSLQSQVGTNPTLFPADANAADLFHSPSGARQVQYSPTFSPAANTTYTWAYKGL